MAGEGLISAAKLSGGIPTPKPWGFWDGLDFMAGDDYKIINTLSLITQSNCKTIIRHNFYSFFSKTTILDISCWMNNSIYNFKNIDRS